MRLALDILLRAARSQERVAILVQVADLAGDVLVKIFAEYEARGKAVADAGLGVRARAEDGAIVIPAVADRAAQLRTLARSTRRPPAPTQPAISRSHPK